MGSCVLSAHLKFSSVIGWSLAALLLFTSQLFYGQSQQNATSASLRGTVRTSEGKIVAGATIYLQAQDPGKTKMVQTDAQGNYRFAEVNAGVYVLRADLPGYGEAKIPSLFFGPKEEKTADLILTPVKIQKAQPPEFFDQPSFSVAGVTDTTNLGGHGADTVVRTREMLAKDTVSLSKGSGSTTGGSSGEKERALRERVQREPHSFEANHLLGKELDANGKARDAIPYLQRAEELKADDVENSYDLALANEHAGNYERAREQAGALIAHHDTAALHHLLGDVQEEAGNSLEAVHEYQRAAEMDPSEPYLFDWGAELLLHHAPEPAVEVFTRGNRRFPQSVRMLIGLGAAWFARGAYDQAVRKICEASDLNPEDSVPYLFLGKLQSAEAAPSAEAVERLRRFVHQQPQNAEANYNYAMGLWKLRKGPQDTAGTAQVEALLANAVHYDPKFAAAYLQLGILHSEQRNYPRAISDYQQAIQTNPQMQTEEAHYRLAQAYRQTGNAAKADAELEVYHQISKESAQKAERERHEIRQFVYTLRDQAAPQSQ